MESRSSREAFQIQKQRKLTNLLLRGDGVWIIKESYHGKEEREIASDQFVSAIYRA